MSKLSPTLLALSLALALAATPADAQQINTSQGVRTLPRTSATSTEAQLRQAMLGTEQILDELLRDIDALERARTTATGGATGLAEQVKRANADYERARTTFEQQDQQYRTDLASFQQRQSAMDADVQNQRTQAAKLQELPSAQRDYAEVVRLNDWAAKIGKEREGLEAERTRLLAAHDKVETDRAALAKQRTDAEAKLKASREGVVGEFGGVEGKRKLAYGQLRTAVRYMEGLREQLVRVATRAVPRSQLLESANAKLRAWEASAASR